MQEFVDSWTMNTVRTEITIQSVIHLSVRKCLILGDHTDHVHTETIDSFFTPEVHHIINFPANLVVLPVQIRLLLGKQVKIIHICLCVIFPG